MSNKLVLGAAVVGLLLIGGSLSSGMLQRGGDSERATSSVADGASLRAEIRSQPVAAVMSANVLLLSLTDAAGFPVKDAELAAYFVMPGMFCGHIPAAVQPLAAGEYEITGIPVMEGAWQANVTIKQGEETLVAVHSFKAK